MADVTVVQKVILTMDAFGEQEYNGTIESINKSPFPEKGLINNSNSPANQDPLRWKVLLTVIVGTFLDRLDQTIIL